MELHVIYAEWEVDVETYGTHILGVVSSDKLEKGLRVVKENYPNDSIQSMKFNLNNFKILREVNL